MSNSVAVAAVTATLRRNLQLAFDADVPGVAEAKVVHVRPNAPAAQLPAVGANVYLYQVTPNAAGRNADAPTRGEGGALVQRPRAAIDLHYLLSFYGDDAQLEPQRLMAIAAAHLHGRPVLERQAILDTIAAPFFNFVRDADLADAPDLVRFVPTSLSVEEMSKLWSVFFQTPYVLSLSYRAQIVFLDSAETPRAPALPVRRVVAVATPTRLPVVDEIRSRSAPAAPIVSGQPILAGHTLVLVGRELASASLRVRIGSVEVTPAASSDSQVEAVLPALSAGTHLASVVQPSLLGVPPVSHDGPASPPVPFVLSPQVSGSVTDDTLRVTFAPPLAARQRVSVFLNELSSGVPRVFRFEASPEAASASLDVDVTAVPAATYLLRAQVDGAESPLAFNSGTGRYDSPTVSRP